MTYTWAFQPQQLPTEVLEWKTDVIRAKGQEQRICLREAPRQGYSYDYVWNAQQLAKASLFIQARGDEEIYLPIWTEFTEVSSLSSGATTITFNTTNAHYQVGGYVIVWGDESTYDVREILTLDDTYLTVAAIDNDYSPALVMPVKTAIFASPLQVNRLANSHSQASVEFISTDSWKLADAGGGEVIDDAVTPLAVVNHDAEDGGTTGWTEVSGDWYDDNGQISPAGGYNFKCPDNTLCKMTQSVSLEQGSMTTTVLDTGQCVLKATWWQGSPTNESADPGYICLDLLDSSGESLKYVESPEKYPTGPYGEYAWEKFIYETIIPKNARDVEISLVGRYVGGTNNSFRFDEITLDILQSGSIVYRGQDVVTDCIVVNGQLSETYSEEVDTFDSESGLIWIGNAFNYPAKTTMLQRHLGNKSDAWTFREWLHTRRGRWKEFYLPSWSNDLEIVAPINSTDTAITITDIGYTDHATDQRDIMLRDTSGNNYYFQIVGSDNPVSGYENIGLDRAVGVSLALSEIELCCFLVPSRLAADRVEINHLHAGESDVAIPVTHVPTVVNDLVEPVPDPLPDPITTGVAPSGMFWQIDGTTTLLRGGFNYGEPFLLTGSTLTSALNTLINCGGNYLRNTMVDFTIAEDGKGGRLHPFAYNSSTGKFDLDTLNTTYFDQLDDMLTEAESRGIVVSIELWDPWHLRDGPDSDKLWYSEGPWSPQNNDEYTTVTSGLPNSQTAVGDPNTSTCNPFYKSIPAIDNVTVLLGYQQDFVDAILAVTDTHTNVIFQIDNESYAPVEWTDYWAAYLHANAAGTVYVTDMHEERDLSDSLALNAITKTSTYDFADCSQNEINNDRDTWYTALLAFRTAMIASGTSRPINAIKIYSRYNASNDTSPDVGLDRMLMLMMGGVAAFRFHKPPAGEGLNTSAQDVIAAAAWFDNKVTLTDYTPLATNDADWLNRDTAEAYGMEATSSLVFAFVGGSTSGFLFKKTAWTTIDIDWYNVATGAEHSNTGVARDAVETDYFPIDRPSAGRWLCYITEGA